MRASQVAIRGALFSGAVLCSNVLPAQVRPTTPPPTAAPSAATTAAARNRAGIRIMTLTSPSFADGGMIPHRFAQMGRDVSPALAWSGAPDSTRSFVLIVRDADAAIGDGTDDVLHWMVWNIPGTTTSLPEGMMQGGQLPSGMRQISASGPYYRGPAAPASGPPHHYVFELYALDITLNVAAVGMSPPATRAAVMSAIATHVRGKGVLVGLYKRPAPELPAPSGTLVITNKTPNTATILDVASGRVLATLPTGQGPHEVVLTSDGATAVVSDYGAMTAGSTLTIIDVSNRRVARTLTLGEYRRPHGLVMMPGDSIVAVTSETNKMLLLVNVRTGAIAKAIATQQNGSHMVGIGADATRAWTGNIGSNTISELDLATGAALRTIDVPAQPEAINVTPDGREVWVGSNATGNLSVVNTSSGAVSTAATGFGWPYRVLFSPDAALVLLPDLRKEELRFVDRRTRSELHRLALPGKGPQGIVTTPDGQFAFLSFSKAAVVALIDVAARSVVKEFAVGETPDGVAFTTRVTAGR